ncbi:hypothetical protein [Nocardioides dongkuii]|uniref:hypothetical protein n=1 Tax=Nocardioides dongkuii TaxID=2760089 RepID=UPI00187829B6|nr:hypothetical protein [Nocardioides dongkuii]
MSEQQAPPGVIPYVEFHTGERRVLTVHLTSGNGMLTSKVPPVVSIDGRQYVVYWGSVSFEVPADRAVHLSVHVEGAHLGQAATALLPPGGALALTYRTDFLSGVGSLG